VRWAWARAGLGRHRALVRVGQCPASPFACSACCLLLAACRELRAGRCGAGLVLLAPDRSQWVHVTADASSGKAKRPPHSFTVWVGGQADRWALVFQGKKQVAQPRRCTFAVAGPMASVDSPNPHARLSNRFRGTSRSGESVWGGRSWRQSHVLSGHVSSRAVQVLALVLVLAVHSSRAVEQSSNGARRMHGI
jgi:hypothetical protein